LELVKQDRPDSPWSRSFRMGRLGFGLAGSYIGYQFQNLFLNAEGKGERKAAFNSKSSRRIREELEQLKGPLMKFGQILSMQTQILPEEAIRELSHLQMRAPGMHATLARSQFRAALGKAPEDVYREFEPEPFAAASLGQVHRAVLKSGEAVAVKIQYPAIRTAIENDFKMLRSATFAGRVTGHVPKSVWTEMERGFLEETDYVHEARNLERFREQLAPLSFVQVPRVWRELSGDRVLTMSLMPGKPLSDYVATKPSQAQRNQIGHRMLELFHFQRLRLHAVHADPHPGNFLIDERGDIGLVDFGCVKEFSKDYAELVWAFVGRDWLRGEAERDRMVRLIWGREAGIRPAIRKKILQDGIAFSDVIYPQAGGVVDFGDGSLLATYTRILNESTRNRLANAEYAFQARAELGFYNLLHLLRAKVNTGDVLATVRRLTG
jgi:predicted unusual protein kinase regulating ubiquinone biosynthesis (AarF/ABC1/UbiB family)